jgi:uncharacterized iron-regulated membrane protein
LNRRLTTTGIPTGNPLVNALMIIVGVLALGAMLVLGVVAILAVASIVIVLAGIVGIRVWWHRRKLKRGSSSSGPDGGRSADLRVIEGEYRSLSTRNDGKRQRSD